MANKTTGSGQWTNMGNVTTNPLGSYSDSKTYNFLDMVSYEGGSYICLENETIGVRPSPGESTDRWFCSSVPGEATPDFKNLVTETKEAAKTAKEKATDAEVSAKNSNDSAMAASSAATLAIDAAKNAENSKDVVAGYKRAAEKAANDAASSKESVDTKIAGLDETFANKTNSSMQSINDAADAKAEEIKTEINTTKQQAINTITNQQDASVNIVKTEGEKIITKVGNDAKTVADDRATVEEATQTVLNNAQEVAQNTQTVASNTEKAAVSAEGAKTSADNAAQSAKSVEDASKQIEQNKKDVDSLKEEIADKATLENGVVKFWKASTEESRTDTLLYSVDISSIGGTGGLDLENLTLSVSQVGNYQRLSMSDGTTTKNVDIPITTITDEQVQNAVNNYMAANPIDETDPTVPDWAKNPTKPTYTASEVGALPDTTKIPSKTSDLQNDRGFLTEHQDLSGYATKGEIPKTASDVGADASGTAENKVSAHNTATDAHNDIRLLVQGLTDRLNALADSDDETLDQMSEVVAYIKSNKSLIDAITTGKVSVSDIVDNLTTNVSNKPLSAAQGVILKTMIDEITIPEKLPNPYSLTFTGAVAGIYNGSEALTINIPSGRDGSTYYVTPEQFGAIGDGVTDDSEAFRQAIETEKPIVCTYGKKYNCITEIVSEKTTINIIGNRCMLKNFHLKINVNSGETSWINAYPVPNSTIQDVNFNGTDKPEYCIKTGIPIKFLNCKWDFYDIMVKNYGSYMDYIVFENCAFKNHSGTHYAIDLAYLGDQHVFRECDFGGTGENRKFVLLSGCQSATIINCLFAGDHIIYSSNVVFIGCHMEGVSSITVGGDKTWNTILNFIDCYFWDMYTLSLAESSSFFESCTFYISHQSIGGGRDYTSYNQKNCKILCATTSDPNSYVNLDDLVNRKEFPERKTLSNPCVYQSSVGTVAQGRNWPLDTGSYTYLFFPSTNPYSIDGWNFYYTKATLSFRISSDSSIVSFTGNSDFAGYYLWCYRTSPDGTIHRAIMPMHMDRFYDYGQYLNGITWVEVDAIPDPKTSLATFKNGIYYSGDGSCNGKNCMCINTSNGIISYISEDGVVHKNEYVDASEVMY